jgi:hypothetical protein
MKMVSVAVVSSTACHRHRAGRIRLTTSAEWLVLMTVSQSPFALEILIDAECVTCPRQPLLASNRLELPTKG